MRLLDVIQGSPEWLAARALHNTASEAPIVMGASKYTSRADLMRQKATGIAPEVDAHKQALFDKGHAAEAAARVIAEEFLGDDLYPVTAVCEETGLLASLDGLTMDETTVFECKLWNERLVAQVRSGELEPHYYWQLEQELLVTKAERVFFVCSDGTREKFAAMEYRPVAGRREQLIAAWKQFDTDRAGYALPAAAAVVVAAPVQALPSVSVQVEGSITIKDNFAAFEVAMRDFLEHRLIREPKTDQDFADLEVQIKAMKGAEAALKAAEAQMLAQVESIDTAKKTKDMLLKLVSDNRKLAENLLASEKERRRGEIVAGGITAMREHVAALNTRLGKPYMPAIPVDFAGAIKGKSSLAKMEDAVATTLATGKIEANRIADGIDLNLRWLRENAKDHSALFPDVATIVLKAHDDLVALAQNRINEAVAAEQRRMDAERERIRKEEADKLLREQEARDRETARIAALAEAEAAKPAPTPAPAALNVTEELKALPVLGTLSSVGGPGSGRFTFEANPTVVQIGARAPAPESTATIRLGQINERLAPIQLSADGLATLGFTPVATDKSAKLYREADFDRMCAALVKHIEHVRQPLAA